MLRETHKIPRKRPLKTMDFMMDYESLKEYSAIPPIADLVLRWQDAGLTMSWVLIP
jgi:hypothetical protein